MVIGTVVGGLVGAVSSIVSQAAEQLTQGVGICDIEIDPVNVAIAATAGAATGLLAASGAGIAAQVAGNVAASAASNTLTQVNNIANERQDSWSWSSFACDVTAGAISGIWGGRGASYGNSGGIFQSGVQATKRILNNMDEFGKAIAYYAKTAHQSGGSFVLTELGKALAKGFAVATGNTVIQNTIL